MSTRPTRLKLRDSDRYLPNEDQQAHDHQQAPTPYRYGECSLIRPIENAIINFREFHVYTSFPGTFSELDHSNRRQPVFTFRESTIARPADLDRTRYLRLWFRVLGS